MKGGWTMKPLTDYALCILICHCSLQMALGATLQDSAMERKVY